MDEDDDIIRVAVNIAREGLPSLGPYELGVSPLYTQFIGRHSSHMRCIPFGHCSRQFVEIELTEYEAYIELTRDPRLESIVAVHFPPSVSCREMFRRVDSKELPLADIRRNMGALPQPLPLDEGQPLELLSSHLQLPFQIPGRSKFYNQYCACLQVMDDQEIEAVVQDTLKCTEKLDLTQCQNYGSHVLRFQWKKPPFPFDDDEPDFIDHIVLIEKVVTNNAKAKNSFLQAL